MIQYVTLNPIAECGLGMFDKQYKAVEDIEDADVALVRSASMHEMEIPDSLVAIARAGAGVNNIPLDECAKKGIVVFNTPGANANGVKELVIAGMLLAARDVVGGINWCLDNAADENIGKTAEKAKKKYAGTEIFGKKLGVIGLGAIGVKVANAAVDLGMEVYGYDPYVSVQAAWNLSQSVKHTANLEDIYKECDYITIHVPLMDATKGMIDKAAIDMMKPTAVVLNFARDLLVDEDAMVKALEDETIAKYVTDFANPTVVGKKNVILTPHLGASTEESEDNCAIMAVKEVKEYMENGNIKNSVNYPACDMGVCTRGGRVTILHENVTGMINIFSSVLADAGINIEDMTSKSKGDNAYTMLDLNNSPTADVVKALESEERVYKVRVIK